MSDSVRPRRRQPIRLPRPWDSPGKNTGVGCHFLLQSMKVKSESEVPQSFPTLSDPRDCSLPGSSVHGIFQARVLEWVPSPSLYFIYSVREYSSFILLHVAVQFSQDHLLKRLFSSLVCFCLLCHKLIDPLNFMSAFVSVPYCFNNCSF